MALTDKLTAIGDAIREKTGKSELMTLDEMPTEIAAITTGGGGGELPEDVFKFTGNCEYKFYRDAWTDYINKYGELITTEDITHMTAMFSSSIRLEEIPFTINATNAIVSVENMFNGCQNLKSLPKINNLIVGNRSYLFQQCYDLRVIPNDFCENWDWSNLEATTNSATSYTAGGMLKGCYSLRSFPIDLLRSNPNISYSYWPLNGFENAYSLDEITNIPLPYTGTWTSNAFYNLFKKCYRLKNITFATKVDGTPYKMSWKNQNIDLGNAAYVGYCNLYTGTGIIDYNSGITTDTRINDDESYQALKNNPNSWTASVDYSRYNHDSAVATINSLPDTSAYIASAGGTNTIKFKGTSGSKTDGGAINTLTEAEIAVATAKGWTVTLQ